MNHIIAVSPEMVNNPSESCGSSCSCDDLGTSAIIIDIWELLEVICAISGTLGKVMEPQHPVKAIER